MAERGFSSAQLFGQWTAQQTDWTVRLRRNDGGAVAAVYAMGAHPLDAGRLWPGERVRVPIGRGTPEHPRVSAWMVVNETWPVPPTHKRKAGTERERAARAKGRARHRAPTGRKSRTPSATAQRSA